MTISVKTLLQSNLLDFSAGIQNTTIGNLIASPGTFTTVTSNVIVGNSVSVAGTVISTGSNNSTGFIVGNGAVSNVALGYIPTAGTAAEMAIRDYSTVPSTMYFDNSIRSNLTSASFQFRSTSSFTQWAKIDQYGLTLPTRPAFRVYGGGTTSITATNTLTNSNFVVDYNQGSYLTPSTGVFTAPVAGLYQIDLIARWGGTASISSILVRKTAAVGGAQTTQVYVEWAASSTAYHMGGSTITKLAVGDTLTLVVTSGTVTFDANDAWSVAYIG